jgi:hypothetical protein
MHLEQLDQRSATLEETIPLQESLFFDRVKVEVL